MSGKIPSSNHRRKKKKRTGDGKDFRLKINLQDKPSGPMDLTPRREKKHTRYRLCEDNSY